MAIKKEKTNTANIDVGYISQNVYLYCASEGLVTGARGMVDRATLGPKLSLRTDQMIILAQSVGILNLRCHFKNNLPLEKGKEINYDREHIDILATGLSLRDTQVRNTIKLLVEAPQFRY